MQRRKSTLPNRELRSRGVKCDKKPLPLVHTTSVGKAREIIASRKLEVNYCSVFDKELLYFFSYRPAFRLADGHEKSDHINRFPFVFIVDPVAVPDPYHVYPFDTGAAVADKFDIAADPDVFLEDYELDPTHSAILEHIEWVFGSAEAYLNGEIQNNIEKEIPDFESVTKCFIDIARLASSGSNRPDARASAVEVTTSSNIQLKKNVLLIVLPKQYLESKDVKNTKFIEMLKRERIEWRVYNWQPNTVPNEFLAEITNILETFYRGTE